MRVGSWNSLIGRTENAIENLRNAAREGSKHGAEGYLITDWGDHFRDLPNADRRLRSLSDASYKLSGIYGWSFFQLE